MKTFHRVVENCFGGRRFLVFESDLEAAVKTFVNYFYYPDKSVKYTLKGISKIIIIESGKEFYIYRVYPAGKVAELEGQNV